ncbi:MAG: hypothetical protein RIS70_424 [Planctomycetota bacterium]
MKKWLLATVLLSAGLPVYAIPPVQDPAAAKKPQSGIQVLDDLSAKESAFKPARDLKPIVLKSEKEAAEVFSDEAVAKLLKNVDFSKQVALVFAWSGSGQDRLDYSVARVAPNDPVARPEHVVFSLEPGRTRDLRPHTQVFVLRSDSRWSMGVSWKQAQEILKNKDVESVMQMHSRLVTIFLADGTRHETVEPGLDDVIKFLQEIKKNIPIATE